MKWLGGVIQCVCAPVCVMTLGREWQIGRGKSKQARTLRREE